MTHEAATPQERDPASGRADRLFGGQRSVFSPRFVPPPPGRRLPGRNLWFGRGIPDPSPFGCRWLRGARSADAGTRRAGVAGGAGRRTRRACGSERLGFPTASTCASQLSAPCSWRPSVRCSAATVPVQRVPEHEAQCGVPHFPLIKLGIHPFDPSSTTWMMGMEGAIRFLRALSSRVIHSFPFTGSVNRKHAPPLALFSAQIRPP
jgi:hypothetical protein